MRHRDRAGLLRKLINPKWITVSGLLFGLWATRHKICKLLVVLAVFICAVVILGNLEKEIEAGKIWHDPGRSATKVQLKINEPLTKFRDVQFGIRERISVRNPSEKHNGPLGLECVEFPRLQVARKKVLSTKLGTHAERGFRANYLPSKVALFDAVYKFFLGWVVFADCKRGYYFNRWCVPTVLSFREESPVLLNFSRRLLSGVAARVNILEMNEGALHSYKGIVVDSIGVEHSARLNPSENCVNRSDPENADGRASGYGIVVLGVAKPFENAFKFHWYWLPFGIAFLLLFAYGFLLFLYGLGDEGSSVILLKGLGLSIGGWLAGVFCLFHWLYQQ